MRSTSPSSRSTIRTPGESPRALTVLVWTVIRWHEHDADEIQSVADECIAEACKRLEEAGWAKESIKVIGEHLRKRA